MAKLWELLPENAVLEDGKVTVFPLGGNMAFLNQNSVSNSVLVQASNVLYAELGDTFGWDFSGDNMPVPATGSVAMVFKVPTPNYGLLSWGEFQIGDSPTIIGRSPDTVSLPYDTWVSVVMTWDTDGSEVFVDGELADTLNRGWGDGSFPAIYPYRSAGLLISYIAGFDEIVDGLTLSADLMSRIPTPAAEFTGSIPLPELQFTAAIEQSDPWVSPDPEPLPPPGGNVVPPVVPAPTPPPVGVPEPIIYHTGERMGAPTLVDGWPHDWVATATVDDPLGVLQIVVEGVDITYFNGVATPHPTWSRVEPFGAQAATIRLPQLTPFVARPVWCQDGANVEIRLNYDTGGHRTLFTGIARVAINDEPEGVFALQCIGTLFQADLLLKTPDVLSRVRDTGTVIAETLNNVPGRRYKPMTATTLGIPTAIAGGWEPRLTGFVQELLATALVNGKQYTVKCAVDQPVLEAKDTDTIQWEVRNGQRGVEVDLESDEPVNVIYGEGINTDGGRWRNCKYPNWRPDDTPPYPGPVLRGMTVGWTDAQTTTGNGVSLWQETVGRPVTGRMSQQDRVAWRDIQRRAGIQVDNYLGPQTWAATFDTGSNTGTLDDAYIAPLAYVPEVEPFLYTADGQTLGPNPVFDASQIRSEKKYDFGQGVSKAEGIRASREILARDSKQGLFGSITFIADPYDTSKYLLTEGSNGIVRGYPTVDGLRDVKLHVSAADYSDGAVTLTVDEKARDYPTLDALMARDRNSTDPAQAVIKRLTRGKTGSDRVTFDAESPAGIVPRHAIFGNLWTVLRIPFGVYGSIVNTSFTVSNSARPFSLAVFSKPVTANQLLSVVGNPLTREDNPWDENADRLEEMGLLQAWGWKKQPAGYYPGQYSNPDGEGQSPVTGRLVDDSSWEFASGQPPWLWVAEIAGGASSTTYIEGRFLPGADW